MPQDYFQARLETSFSERASFSKNSAAKALFKLMDEKKTCLAVAVDVENCNKFFKIVNFVKDDTAIIKTHVDILSGYDDSFPGQLKDLAYDHSFLILEDRKFADIGNTAKLQYSGGIYKICDWAHLVTVHSNPGPGVVEGLAAVVEEKKIKDPRGGLLLAQMSSKGNLLDENYTKKTVEMAGASPFSAGFIGTGSVPSDLHNLAAIAPSEFPILTPGIQFSAAGDSLKQQYCTPELAVENGSDCIIVGRGIIAAEDAKKAAQDYRKAAWQAYEKRVK